MDSTVIYSILGLLSTLISSVVIRVITSKEFRAFTFKGLKEFMLFFMGKKVFTHMLFENKEYYKEIIKDISMDCKEKELIFETLLNNKATSIIDLSKEWIKKNLKEVSKWSKLKLRTELLILTNCIVKRYEENTIADFVKYKNSIKEGNEIYNLVYKGIGFDGEREDFKGFKELHNLQVELIKQFIDRLPLYTGAKNTWLVFQLFNMFDSALLTAIHNVNDVMHSINGRLCNDD